MYTKNNRRHNRGGKNKMLSNIDPNKLIKKARQNDKPKFISTQTFKELNLHQRLEKNILAKGYERPTEIQEKSIPALIEKNDLIGIAATGTGKTGAFLIPIIHQMLNDKTTSALVVVPTRELAQQVREEYRSLTIGLNFQSSCFIGGTNVSKDIAVAKQNNPFIVATPGRLNDLVNRKALNLENTSILVLDEFDRMLDMGFINDVRKIDKGMIRKNQTMLFSATADKSQENIIKEFVKSPIRVNISSGSTSSNNVNQEIIKVSNTENKFDVLLELLNENSFEKVILFTETKRTADNICKKLRNKGLLTDVIHGNKSQNYRSKAIKLFKLGKTRILVATDVAARGIDIDNVTHVVNYQLPRTMDSYIHRVGRTGRADKVGMAYTFVN